jgi:hypothetical protein
MPRTGNALSFVAADVDIRQAAGDAWLNLSCYATSIAVTGGDRSTGEVNVFCDERPIVKAGKKASQDVTVRFAYTEEMDDDELAETGWAGELSPFETIRLWDDAVGGAIEVRYFPAGRAPGNYVFHTEDAIITSFLDPQGEAGSGDPVLGEFTVKTEELHKSCWGGGPCS